MRIKGLDNGYLYTKDDERRIFKSSISKDATDIFGGNYITIDGIAYCVGVGKTTVELNKIVSETNKVCTIMNLAMTGEDDYFLVVGLPIGQFKAQKEQIKLEVMKYNGCKVEYKEKPFKVSIRDVFVFPQGAASLLNERNLTDGDFIIVDIGGLTIDVALIELINGSPIMHKSNTWFDGMQKLYSNVIYAVNNKYNMTLPIDYAEKILRQDLMVDGEFQDTSFLDDIKLEFLQDITKELQLNYPSRTTPIYVTGGGGIVLYKTLNKTFKNTTLINDAQFSNAKGYHKIGLIKYKKYTTIPMSTNKTLHWEIPNYGK